MLKKRSERVYFPYNGQANEKQWCRKEEQKDLGREKPPERLRGKYGKERKGPLPEKAEQYRGLCAKAWAQGYYISRPSTFKRYGERRIRKRTPRRRKSKTDPIKKREFLATRNSRLHSSKKLGAKAGS